MPARRSRRRCGPNRCHRDNPRPPKYGPDVVAALTVCWTVLGMPAGKRLAPMLDELVVVLRHFGELGIDEATAALLVSMSAATIDRRLAPERRKHQLKGRVHHQAGIAAQESDPGAHLGGLGRRATRVRRDRPGLPRGRHPRRPVRVHADGHRHRHRVDREPLRAQQGRQMGASPHSRTSPTRCRSRSWGWTPTTDRNSSTTHLLQWCEERQITFTRARPGNKNDGCHVEQKNWAVVRTVVGYHRYDTAAELLLLNEIWQLQSKLTNYFYPQQKLMSKVRRRRQGVQEIRHRRHPVSPRDRSPDHDRGPHSRP